MGFALAALPLMAALGGGGAALAGGATLGSTLGIAGMASSALGGLTSAVGSYESGQATKAQDEYQAEVAAQNQKLAAQNAQMATAAGEAQAEQAGLKQRADLGQIRAAEAASGIDVNSGSAADVQASQSERDMLNALVIRSNAERTAYGYQTQALADSGQAQLYKAAGQQAPIAGGISAAGSLLSGAAGVANQYSSWQRLQPSTTDTTPSPTPTFFGH